MWVELERFLSTNHSGHIHTLQRGPSRFDSWRELQVVNALNMLWSSLTVLSLLFSPVLPLTCYVCSSSSTNEDCNKNAQDCPAPLNTCMTTVDTLGLMKAIVKQCASQATCNGAASAASVDANGNGNRVDCCHYNMCNYSGAESIHKHTTLMLLTACVLALQSR